MKPTASLSGGPDVKCQLDTRTNPYSASWPRGVAGADCHKDAALSVAATSAAMGSCCCRPGQP
eukprot:339363-Alexandrium_andersonii.AAC.1